MKETFAEIISIGDELLIGQVVNTNASWMAVSLNKIGIKIKQITTVSDSANDIKNAIKLASKNSDIVLLTGGLGPTRDDITKHVLAEHFDSEMIFHEPTYEHIKNIFSARHYVLTEINKKQAEVPDNCIPLHNRNGTAPGMWFEVDNVIIVSMPGVPFEMKGLMTDQILPRLKKKYNLNYIFHKTVMTIGIGESALAEKIQEWENSLPDFIKLAYLPQPGVVRLRLSASGIEKTKIHTEVGRYCNKLSEIIPDFIFGYDDIPMEEIVGMKLKEKEKTVSTVESCTGGYIAHLITQIAGSSEYFNGAIISYSNEIKESLVGVNHNSIDSRGAVSQEVVEEMAKHGRLKLNTDYCLATSGIAGPDGGTYDKPVGTVWIAMATPSTVVSKLFHFGEHRIRNIRRSALTALDMLRRELINTTYDNDKKKH
jgi:competence/damage-inducible protein CinA-like protein